MEIGGSYKIYNKEWSPGDYLTVALNVPILVLNRHESDWCAEEYTNYVASAATKIMVVYSDTHLYVKMSILGFGFYIKRQWGY